MLKNLIKRWQMALCSLRVKAAISKSILASNQNEYNKLFDFFEQFELIRYLWTNALKLNEGKQQISMFALVYYLLDFQDDDSGFYYGEEKKQLTIEEENFWLNITDLIENPKDEYKNHIIDYLGKKHSLPNAKEIFDCHLNHLHKINFVNFLMCGYFDQFVSRYLLFFLYTEEFAEIDLDKDLIQVDKNHWKVNLEELRNQFDKIEFMYVISTLDDMGMNFKFKQSTMQRFIDMTFKRTLNNGMLMLRNKFSHLK